MIITDLEDYAEITAYLINADDPKCLRILWVQDRVDWNSLSKEQIAARSLRVDGEDEPVLLLDSSVIGMN